MFGVPPPQAGIDSVGSGSHSGSIHETKDRLSSEVQFNLRSGVCTRSGRVSCQPSSMREPTVRASPFAPGIPATETPALSRTETSMRTTIALYLRKAAERTSACRRPIAGAATVAVLCGSVLLSGCQQPMDPPQTFVIMASATANEPAPVLAAPDRSLLLNAGAGANATAYVV